MAERTVFGKLRPVLTPPDQIEIQTKSYEEFLQKDVPPEKRADIGLQGIFKSIFPIESYDGHYVLDFIQYRLGRAPEDRAAPEPKDDPLTALREGVTYSAALNVEFALRNGESTIREWVYLGDVPLMCEDGAFVINGAERVIVSQLHRSPGICTERAMHANGTPLYSVRIIPDRGSWLEFQFDTNHKIWVYMDRRRKGRKFLVSTFLRCLEYSSDRDILSNFYAYERKAIGYETIRTSGQSMPPAARLATMVFVENMRAGKELVADQYDFVTARVLRKLAQAGVKEVKVLDAGWDARRLENLVFPEDIRDPKTNALLAHRYEFVKVNALNQLAQAGIPELEALDVAWDGGVMLETMRADPTHSQEEALKDIYHRLRPGDPVTASNAQQLVRRLFFDNRRYDLGKVGRYKLNLKLRDFRDPTRQEPPELPPELRVLDKSDIIAALRLLAAVNTTAKQPKGGDRIPQWRQATTVDIDDIDHLGSRRIRTAGELLENQCRIGLARTERTIHERMTMAGSQNADNESEMLRPTRLVNSKTFGAVVNEFFARSQLSQFMDQTNPLSGLAHKRRLSALGPGGLSRDRAGFEVRDVYPSHYGRICPIETPEGPNIGLISSLGIYAKINQYGFIETPYRKVEHEKDGTPHVTDEVVYMSADQEEKFVIAQANARLDAKNHFIDPTIRVRYHGEFQEAPNRRVQFMDVSPMQVISIAAGLIPFLEHDDANRALMGANMMRQAVPLLRTERPYVATGLEGAAARDSRVIVVADEPGVVAEVDATHVLVTRDGKKPPKGATGKDAGRYYKLQKFRRTNASTCFNQWPVVSEGQRVKKGDVLADGPATDQGELAIGKNLLVAYMPWCGYNFEDAILISERCLRDDTFTSLHIVEFECQARDTKLGPEEITRDIPNVGEDALRNLDDRGVIRVGAEVKPGDILVGKVTPKAADSEPLPEERLLRAIFGEKAAEVRDTSLKVQPGTFGIVMDVKVSSGEDAPRGHRASGGFGAFAQSEKPAKPKTLKEIEKDYSGSVKKLEKELLGELSNALLGSKIPFDVEAGADGSVLIPANRKITQAMLKKVVAARDDVRADKSPVGDQLAQILEKSRRKFVDAEDRRKRDLDDLERGSAINGAVRFVKVYLAEKKTLSVGDKLSGRHGNKGVVARIQKDCEMPFLPNGQPVDIVLNPMGVPSRMNLGQVFETHLGAACRALGIHAATPVFDGIHEDEIHRMLGDASKKEDFGWIKEDGKSVLYDGRTGERFDQRVMVGVTYMLKLHHLVTDKIHARSVGPYSLVTQQPLGGKAQAGGQRMGEMEVWALEAYGVAYALQEMLTVKSDDVAGRTRIYESIVKGQNSLNAGMPETFKVLISELKGLCLDMRLEGEKERAAVAAALENN